MEAALERIFAAADQAIAEGKSIIILSDRDVDQTQAAIPALLAVSGLHHHLIRNGTRTRVGLVLESGEPREVHHYAVLIGYGCGAINPYLVFDTIEGMIADGLLTDVDAKTGFKNYAKAVTKGVIKIASKIGISTIQSYRGAQIFEALGLNQPVIDQYFTWTASRFRALAWRCWPRKPSSATATPSPTGPRSTSPWMWAAITSGEKRARRTCSARR
jgi:glutamate synthase (ferredoxin)